MKTYTIELTEHQLKILSMACDRYSRLICGQLENSLQEACEAAWERDHKTPEHPHAIGSEDWYTMRNDLEAELKGMKAKYWGLTGGSYNGIGYDKTADLLYDMHKSMDKALWENMNAKHKEMLRWSVMADGPMGLTDEPLIKVKEKE